MKDVIVSIAGFVAGGGLVSLATLRYVRKVKAVEAKVKETESDVSEFQALRSIIDGLAEEVKSLQERLHSQAEMSDVLCHDCVYKQFYLEMEKRANERINAKTGAAAVLPYSCPRGRGVVFAPAADGSPGGTAPGAG